MLDRNEGANVSGVGEQHFNVRQDVRQQRESASLLGHVALLLLDQLIFHGGHHVLQLEHQALLLKLVGFAKISVKRDPVQCQKRPSTVSKET